MDSYKKVTSPSEAIASFLLFVTNVTKKYNKVYKKRTKGLFIRVI